MSNVFYPGLLTTDETIKVMGEVYWPTLVTLNAAYGFQVSAYVSTNSGPGGKYRSAVHMINAHGMPTLVVQHGAMTTKRNKYQGEGVSLVNINNSTEAKSKNVSYINRAINLNADVKAWLAGAANISNYFDQLSTQTIDTFKSSGKYGRKYLSCSTSEDAVLLKHALHTTEQGEPLSPTERIEFDAVMQKYKDEVIDPNRLFTEEYESFFKRGRCAFLNVTEYNKRYVYSVGVLNPNVFLDKGNKVAEWLTPVKLYNSLDDMENKTLRDEIYARLVMIKLRHKEHISDYFDVNKGVPILNTNISDGLMIARNHYGDHRSRQTLLINLG